jgi:hypothetical protein
MELNRLPNAPNPISTRKEVNPMANKIWATVLALSLFGLFAMVTDASAKRRCPRGQEDINNVCVPR